MSDEAMQDGIPSIMSHTSIGVTDYAQSKAFYEAVLETIGAKVVMEVNADGMNAAAFGKFWVQTPHDGQAPSVGNGTHFGFLAPNNDAVHAFWDKAIELGASPDGEPGPRPHYGKPYYGCFVRDPDGHKIEAMAWNAELDDGHG